MGSTSSFTSCCSLSAYRRHIIPSNNNRHAVVVYSLSQRFPPTTKAYASFSASALRENGHVDEESRNLNGFDLKRRQVALLLVSRVGLVSSSAILGFPDKGLAVVKQGLLAGRIPGLSEPDEPDEQGVLDGNDQNVLQKHVNFFDQDKDGVVYPWETFRGFREIGCGILLSSLASVFINVSLSAKTRPVIGSLLISIQRRIATHNTTFVPAKFEEIFGKHVCSNANALTSDELMTMLKSKRVPKDYAGWIASYAEWKILYMLCKDKNGLLHKDTIRAVYDGTLFEQMAMEKALAGKKA